MMKQSRQSTSFDRVRRLGRSLADVETGTAYGSPALTVNGKMFACIAVHRTAEPNSLAVRMSAVERDLRVAADANVYYLTPHYADHPVVLARLDRIGDDDLKELLEVGCQFERAKAKAKAKRPRQPRPGRS